MLPGALYLQAKNVAVWKLLFPMDGQYLQHELILANTQKAAASSRSVNFGIEKGKATQMLALPQ
jgi:hypothetical protein